MAFFIVLYYLVYLLDGKWSMASNGGLVDYAKPSVANDIL